MATDEEIIEKDFKESHADFHNVPNIAISGITIKKALWLMALARQDGKKEG